MIKVGDKEQINSFSFVVKDNEIAQAEMTFPGSNVPFRLSFTFLPGDVSGLAEWKWESDIVKFTFRGWRNSLGSSFSEPAKFGDLGNRKIYLQIAHHLIGPDTNVCQAFVLLGAPNA